jgi:hypothetical protein
MLNREASGGLYCFEGHHQGIEPGQPGRQLEQPPGQLPVSEPRQELTGQPEHESRLPPRRSLSTNDMPDGCTRTQMMSRPWHHQGKNRFRAPVLVAAWIRSERSGALF